MTGFLTQRPAARPDDSTAPPAPAPAQPARDGTGSATTAVTPPEEPATALADVLEAGFRAQRMSFVAGAIAADIDLAVAAHRRTWWQRILGRRPAGSQSDLSSARRRLAEHLNRHSVWLHNSLRGAAALAIAVLLARTSGLDHSFWVVFGILAVLRTNAVNTGQTVGRALLGTVIGFLIAVALIIALGSHPVVLWLLLPAAIVLIGLERSVTSFTAGQAGFTVVLLVLFTIIEPDGWHVGPVRIQDMALGCAVSLLVGALFWPRGAGSALGQALGEAFSDGGRYVRGAVAYGPTRCDWSATPAPEPTEDLLRATASARRLDDAFRGYLAERGTKRLSLPDVTTLVNAVAALQLTGDAVVDPWSHADYVPHGDRTAARLRLLTGCTSVVAWFETSGRALAGLTAPPGRPVQRHVADAALWDGVRHELAGGSGSDAAATSVRVIWTADHLDTLRRMQPLIVHPVQAVGRP